MEQRQNNHAIASLFSNEYKEWAKEERKFLLRYAEKIDGRFNHEELRELCFILECEYDDLSGQAKYSKARELVLYLDRRNRLGELQNVVLQLRPKTDWSIPPMIIEDSWKAVNWYKAGMNYTNRLQRLYGHMRVFGQAKPVSLKGVFTDVFVYDQPNAWRRFTVEQLEKHIEEVTSPDINVERWKGIDIVKRENRLFILGRPGAGKTTFLKYVVLQACDGQVNKIPVYVGLREWSDSGMTILNYVASQFQPCNFPDAGLFIKRLLESGKIMVLFDGLDEVSINRKQYNEIINEINIFTRKYFQGQYLITCRTASTDFTFDQFMYVEMADFTLRQIQTFARKWFSKNAAKKKVFLSEIENPENRGLRELASNPLLLTLLCLNFEETMGFPVRRVEIYEEALDALLKKWDSSRSIQRYDAYKQLSLGRKRQLFIQIASKTFEKQQYFIPKKDLVEYIVDFMQFVPPILDREEIDGEGIIDAIESNHGIFIERARGIYSFAHLTFQEYYMARFLVENQHTETMKSAIVSHLTEPKWREVFLLTASLLSDSTEFFEISTQKLRSIVERSSNITSLVSWVIETLHQRNVPITVGANGLLLYMCIAFNLKQDPEGIMDRSQVLRSILNFALQTNPSSNSRVEFTIMTLLEITRKYIVFLKNSETYLNTLNTARINSQRGYTLGKASQSLVRSVDIPQSILVERITAQERVYSLLHDVEDMLTEFLRDSSLNSYSDFLTTTHNLITNLDNAVSVDRRVNSYLRFPNFNFLQSIEDAIDESILYTYEIPTFLKSLQEKTLNYLNEARNMNILANNLSEFTIRKNKDGSSYWQEIVQNLEHISQSYYKHRSMWDMTNSQMTTLLEYVNGSFMLQLCLEVAYLPAREEFESEILLRL